MRPSIPEDVGVLRTYIIEGTYRPARASEETSFQDTVDASSAERAFTVWEKKHHEKPLLRFQWIEPLL